MISFYLYRKIRFFKNTNTSLTEIQQKIKINKNTYFF